MALRGMELRETALREMELQDQGVPTKLLIGNKQLGIDISAYLVCKIVFRYGFFIKSISENNIL
jgi:hypothetical protein